MGEQVLAALQLAPATVAGILYALRVHGLRGSTRAVPSWRQACFYGGLLVQVAGIVALGGLADELFWAHMTEHLLLGDVGALLLVLGLTGPVLAPVLRLPGLRHLTALAHPVVAVGLWAADLAFWHLPAVQDAAVRHEGLHALQHTAFVGCGVLMWLALLGPLPKPAWFGNAARLGYVLVVRLTGAVLGNVLVFGGRPFYDVYAAGERAHGISAAADQNAAGAVMMVEGSFLTLVLLGWVFLRAAREGEERQELLELAASRGVALTEARAARAVAAGRGAELRRRLESG
jgi:putative membrane protein